MRSKLFRYSKGKRKYFLEILTFSVVIILGTLSTYYCSRFCFLNAEEDQLNFNFKTRSYENEYSTVTILADSASKSNEIRVGNPTRRSNFAYVTLISGIDSSNKFRGFLFNVLIIKKALLEFGSKADLIALLGYADRSTQNFRDDIELLWSYGIITFTLPRLLDEDAPLKFAEMALLKITPWNFTEYEKIQFIDGDVMPTKNMDCLFDLNDNTFTSGAASPLNSGWFLAIPNRDHYQQMLMKAKQRLNAEWDFINGWGVPLPTTLTFRGGKSVQRWDFNGADMDQGLLTFFYVLSHGQVVLIDTDRHQARHYRKGLLQEPPEDMAVSLALACCGGKIPTSLFAHFTGKDIHEVGRRRSQG